MFPNRQGFDRNRYIELQSQHIDERRKAIGGKLYLEMGGKLFDDFHASRVLPGFTPDNKIAMLETLKDELEIVVAINAKDLERKKVRADLGIPYEEDALRLIDSYRERGFLVEHVVLTQMEDDNKPATEFRHRLQRLGLKVSRHRLIKGYPTNTDLIVSEDGFGKNEWAETTRDLVVVTAPGPGSGKLATCLSQIYHDRKRGIPAGYAKFETFPIWNLPLDHPVNLAYEAATADLDDVNLIDPHHLKAYGEQVVNYNRDVEVFPLLAILLERVAGSSPYKSPTDMGVNMAGKAIVDDEVCREAGRQEVIRRYYKTLVEEASKELDSHMSDSIALIMTKLGITTANRAVVKPALDLAAETDAPAAAIQLNDGRIVTGKTSDLLGCSAAALLNALKLLANIDPTVTLLAASSITPIQTLKTAHLGSRNPRLHTDEVLIALSVSADSDPNARAALDQLQNLRGCEVHTTTILGSVDEGIFRNLGCLVTSEPQFAAKSLYRKR
ncbi:hypothetical protein HMPREF0044_1542 [Gleimia coleocanis DSM 15436]|uniref:UPF0371 protein HMPREF0044_1542 n=1 Tax=Gleimia coleocanis DSM 15436 TaxID=525245 RepID=C0W289_9ACTO|nr:DUF1846 domain-containing protein [Gleimia coleocanis]EEH63303.1 hypothetical protein HMPREF0044_1542 [Gleimia coleocanis DSM 15436]